MLRETRAGGVTTPGLREMGNRTGSKANGSVLITLTMLSRLRAACMARDKPPKAESEL